MSEAALVVSPAALWTLNDGPPAPAATTVRHLANELGSGFGDGMADKIFQCISACGAITVGDAQTVVIKDDLMEALREAGLKLSFYNTVRKYVFGESTVMGDFQASDAQLAVLSSAATEENHSERQGQPRFSTNVVIWDLFGSLERYNSFEFSRPWTARLVEALGPANIGAMGSDVAMGKAMTILFMAHVVVFKNCYVDTHLKCRYAYLMFQLIRSMDLHKLVQKIRTDFSNRRQGRLVAAYHFNAKEVEGNQAVAELTAKHPSKVIVDDDGLLFMEEGTTDYSSLALINTLCSAKPLSIARLDELRSASGGGASSSNSGTVSMASSPRESPVPALPPPAILADAPAASATHKPKPTAKADGKAPLVPTAAERCSGANMKGLSPASVYSKAGFCPKGAMPPLREVKKVQENASDWEEERMRLERCATRAQRTSRPNACLTRAYA